jgi:hypothetical protein
MKSQTNTFGTNHFASIDAAVKYYNDQEGGSILGTTLNVRGEIESGEIAIGMPPTKENQTAILNRQEGRYFIQEDAPPVREIKVKNNPVVRLLSIIFDRPTKSLS